MADLKAIVAALRKEAAAAAKAKQDRKPAGSLHPVMQAAVEGKR